MTDQPDPEDVCRPVDVDGETIRVRGTGEFTAQDREFAAQIVRTAKAKFEAEPVSVKLRAEIAEALRTVPGRFNIRGQVDAVMRVVERRLAAIAQTSQERYSAEQGEPPESVLEALGYHAMGQGIDLERREQQLAQVRDLRDRWLLMTLEPGQVRRLLDELTAVLAEPAAVNDGPSVTECAEADRNWDVRKAGE